MSNVGCNTVLVLDDDRAMLESIRRIIEPDGFGAVLAASAEEALAYLERNPPPCLFLLDLLMPGVKGDAFLHRLRQDRRFVDVPVIAVSASARGAQWARRDPTIAAYLEKPFEAEELLRVMHAVRSRAA